MQPSDRQGLRDRSRDVSCFACASTAVSAASKPVPLTLSAASFCRGMHARSLPSASDLLCSHSSTFRRRTMEALEGASSLSRPVARGVLSFLWLSQSLQGRECVIRVPLQLLVWVQTSGVGTRSGRGMSGC